MNIGKYEIYVEKLYPMVSDGQFSDQVLFYTEIEDETDKAIFMSHLRSIKNWPDNWKEIKTISNNGPVFNTS